MCPLCITAGTIALASAGAGSAGGLAAVAAKMIRGLKAGRLGGQKDEAGIGRPTRPHPTRRRRELTRSQHQVPGNDLRREPTITR
jgi:hypothetical protein